MFLIVSEYYKKNAYFVHSNSWDDPVYREWVRWGYECRIANRDLFNEVTRKTGNRKLWNLLGLRLTGEKKGIFGNASSNWENYAAHKYFRLPVLLTNATLYNKKSKSKYLKFKYLDLLFSCLIKIRT